MTRHKKTFTTQAGDVITWKRERRTIKGKRRYVWVYRVVSSPTRRKNSIYTTQRYHRGQPIDHPRIISVRFVQDIKRKANKKYIGRRVLKTREYDISTTQRARDAQGRVGYIFRVHYTLNGRNYHEDIEAYSKNRTNIKRMDEDTFHRLSDEAEKAAYAQFFHNNALGYDVVRYIERIQGPLYQYYVQK